MLPLRKMRLPTQEDLLEPWIILDLLDLLFLGLIIRAAVAMKVRRYVESLVAISLGYLAPKYGSPSVCDIL